MGIIKSLSPVVIYLARPFPMINISIKLIFISLRQFISYNFFNIFGVFLFHVKIWKTFWMLYRIQSLNEIAFVRQFKIMGLKVCCMNCILRFYVLKIFTSILLTCLWSLFCFVFLNKLKSIGQFSRTFYEYFIFILCVY